MHFPPFFFFLLTGNLLCPPGILSRRSLMSVLCSAVNPGKNKGNGTKNVQITKIYNMVLNAYTAKSGPVFTFQT